MWFFRGLCGTKTTMLFYILSDHCEILGVIRHNRYLDLGNGSNKFGKHWYMGSKNHYMNFIDCTNNLTNLKMWTSQHGHDGEEAIQPDSLETICSTRWLTRLSAVFGTNSLKTWAPEGRGRGSWPHPGFWNFQKKGRFLSFEWEKLNLTTFDSPGNNLEKSRVTPPWKKSFRRPCLQIPRFILVLQAVNVSWAAYCFASPNHLALR